MAELFALTVYIGNILFAILYQVRKDYQKATYHLSWVIIMQLVIHDMIGGLSK